MSTHYATQLKRFLIARERASIFDATMVKLKECRGPDRHGPSLPLTASKGMVGSSRNGKVISNFYVYNFSEESDTHTAEVIKQV